jgi:hypothetical protein
LKNS